MLKKEYNLGDIVFHKTDTMQQPGIVTGITERPGHFLYLVLFNGAGYECGCYGIELSPNKDYNQN